MVITIDGPAGVGKTTIAKRLAQETGFLFASSGQLYRAVTFLVLGYKLTPPFRQEEVLALIQKSHFSLLENGQIFLIGKVLGEKELHNGQIDDVVSVIAGLPLVREWVNQTLRVWSSGRNLVVEGRDMSSVAFPEADLKVFLDALIEVRTNRRLTERGEDAFVVEEALKMRDAKDQQNLSKAFSSAIHTLRIDTSVLTISDVCETILSEINKLVSN